MDLTDLDNEFLRIMKEFPEKRRSLVTGCGDKMYNKVMQNINSSVKSDAGNLKKSVQKVVGSGGGYAAVRPNYKIAPHTHLIENGHHVIRKGKVVGWANGKHMYRNALNELANELEQDAEKMVDELLGGLDD